MEYWKSFYTTIDKMPPSTFCEFVLYYFKDMSLTILDCGCGNGRDTYALAERHRVTGVDLATCPENANCSFKVDNFCTINKDDYQMIYSRFTFHSITNEDHGVFLNSIQTPGTYLCIETRSDKGQESFRYHGDTHYRNLTNLSYLINLLKDNQFEILYHCESDNLAVYKTENPICIRIICKKY